MTICCARRYSSHNDTFFLLASASEYCTSQKRVSKSYYFLTYKTVTLTLSDLDLHHTT